MYLATKNPHRYASAVTIGLSVPVPTQELLTAAASCILAVCDSASCWHDDDDDWLFVGNVVLVF